LVLLVEPSVDDAGELCSRVVRRLPDLVENAGGQKQRLEASGHRIGKLEDVYVDVETDEPMFGTVKEALIGRHLTFVPLTGLTIGPDNLQVPRCRGSRSRPLRTSKRRATSSRRRTTRVFTTTTSSTNTPPDTKSGRRLARR
jgi:hypothetical protein